MKVSLLGIQHPLGRRECGSRAPSTEDIPEPFPFCSKGHPVARSSGTRLLSMTLFMTHIF